jgi:hypothetical protein
MEEIARLKDQEQNAIARWLLEELASERRWDETFSTSGGALKSLADEALREHRNGDTEDLNPDKL